MLLARLRSTIELAVCHILFGPAQRLWARGRESFSNAACSLEQGLAPTNVGADAGAGLLASPGRRPVHCKLPNYRVSRAADFSDRPSMDGGRGADLHRPDGARPANDRIQKAGYRAQRRTCPELFTGAATKTIALRR
ncbi:hypothetical protein IWW45_006958 [Coemansia sp. RSA 485]|nr:hypothetical protein IWW45_006958 [Coemansia sp. RSA 485]